MEKKAKQPWILLFLSMFRYAACWALFTNQVVFAAIWFAISVTIDLIYEFTN